MTMLERSVLRHSLYSRLHHLRPTYRRCSTIFSRLNSSIALSNYQPARRKQLAPYLRLFHSSTGRRIGVIPEVEQREKPTSTSPNQLQEAALSDEQFHELSDDYIENLLGKLETMAENKPDMDVEFSAGVLNIEFPPAGTYVLNKQPPNKQLWLSSPTSGPKRFNWVVDGDSMHHKEGTGSGQWVYLKDGTTLSGLLKDELGVDIEDNTSGPE